MPKQKTHSGAKKRFNVLKNGTIKRAKANKNHILTKKDTNRKRRLQQGGLVPDTMEKNIKNLLPYKN